VKSQDCTSGFCSDQVCVAAPTTFDSEPPGGDAAGDDAPATDAKPQSDGAPGVDVAAKDAAEAGKDAPEGGDKHDTTAPEDGAKGGD
jgi:hypothetical protein